MNVNRDSILDVWIHLHRTHSVSWTVTCIWIWIYRIHSEWCAEKSSMKVFKLFVKVEWNENLKNNIFLLYIGNVYRSCYWHDPNDLSLCYRLNDINRTEVTGESCHICREDGCNAAMTEYMSSMVLIVVFLLHILL